MKRRLAQLPLHTGKAPPWLFKRMTKLAGAVTMAVVEEFGPAEMLRRLSDPWWFQAFGCVLGFDWHSSGVTTVTCGALKEAAKTLGKDLGILVAGGKGATSRKTPQEIADAADRHAITGGERLIYASRMSAKVDSAAVQDGFGIYHHSFFFTPEGQWCVVQQGMDERSGWARRYHWLAEIIFQAPPSHRDPTERRNTASEGGAETSDPRDRRRWADYSHAHGGKDGTPFPVDRATYDRNITVLTDAVRKARLGENDKFEALRRLSRLGRD